MELIYAELSSPGPARENNEDYVGFWQPQTLEEKRSHGAVAVLADGVVGEQVRGSYKKTDDGKLNAVTVHFGVKSGEKPKKESSNN